MRNTFTKLTSIILAVLVILSCRLPGIPMAAEVDEEAAPVAAVTATAPVEALAAPTEPAILTEPAAATSTPTQAPAAPETAYAVIDPENADQLVEVAWFGKGPVYTLSWISGGATLLVGSSLGIHHYDSQTLAETAFIVTDIFKDHDFVISSPDGRLLAAASRDMIEDIHLYDGNTAQLLRILEGHTQPIYAMAFSPDGAMLASWAIAFGGGSDLTLRMWDVNSGALRMTWEDIGDASQLLFSPDGTVLAVLDSNKVSLWDVDSGQLVNQLEEEDLRLLRMAFAPQGIIVAAIEDDTVYVMDGISGDLISMLEEHEDRVSRVDVSPDGSQLVSATSDGTLRLWDVSSGQLLRKLHGIVGGLSLMGVEFSSDGAWIGARYLGGTTYIWNTNTGRLHSRLEEHSGRVRSLTLSKDGSHLIAGGLMESIKVWDTDTSELVNSLEGHLTPVRSVAYAHDGTMMASGGLWSPNRTTTLYLWDVNAGYQLSRRISYAETVNEITFSPDGSTLAMVGDDDTLVLWDPKTGDSVSRLVGYTTPVLRVAFSPDGSLLASSHSDAIIHLWDPISGSLINTFEGYSGSNLAFSPDGLTLVSASKEEIYLWDISAGQLIATLDNVWDVSHIALSPDGAVLVSVDRYYFHLWEASSGQMIESYLSDKINSLAFSPCGRLLFTGGDDGVVRMWGVPLN
jgi:WD40 repeat protein